MRLKVKIKILLIVLMGIFLAGCYDSIEIDDEVYTMIIGFDKGIHEKLKVTVVYPIYKSSSNSSSSSGSVQSGTTGNENIESMEAPTYMEAINRLGMAVSRKITCKHAKFLVISEELAREGLENYILSLHRCRDIRSSMAVIVTRGSAENFVSNSKAVIGESLPKALELMYLQSKNNNYFPHTDFIDLIRAVLSPREEAIAAYAGINNFNKSEDNKSDNEYTTNGKEYLPGTLPRKGVLRREFVGTAVFKADKMIGHLNPAETQYLLMIRNQFKKGLISLKDKYKPESQNVFGITLEKPPQINAYFKGGKPIINVNMQIIGEIQLIESARKYEDIAGMQDLSEQLREYLSQGIKELVKKSQTEFNSDIFGFGHYISGNFLTIQELEDYNWLQNYSKATVNVNIKAEVKRTGIMFKTSKPVEEDGEK